MEVIICKNPKELGERAAAKTAGLLRQAIEKRGGARLLLSTGASQFTTLEALVKEEVDWSKVEMFHLDEYLDLPPDHPASFVGYLQQRFVSKVPLKAAHFVDTTQGAERIIARLSDLLAQAPVDVGLIGIGENAHIAFNDPPADFELDACYQVVTLDRACRNQQLGEGWFPTLEDVPRQAVSMTVRQIMKCSHIISAVPFAVKAQAVYRTLTSPQVTNQIPATILKTHPDATLYLDADSASLLKKERRA